MNDTPRLISISDAAARLGYGDTSTLRRFAAQGKIPGAQKVGTFWVLPEAWVEDQEKLERPIKGWPRGSGTRKK